VLTTVLLKTKIFWNVTQCRGASSFPRFEGSYCLNLLGQVLWWWRRYNPSRRRELFPQVYGATCQKTCFFI